MEINDRFLNDVQPRIMYYAKADCTRSAIAALPVKHDKDTYKGIEQLANLTIGWYKSFVSLIIAILILPSSLQMCCYRLTFMLKTLKSPSRSGIRVVEWKKR